MLFGAVIAFFALIGSLLPRGYSFTSEIQIAGDQQVVFDNINSLKNWQSWSKQWNPQEIDSLEISYNGEPTGVGAAQAWTDIRGSGKLWITKSEPTDLVEYEMEFANFPRMTSRFDLVERDGGTFVQWSSEGKLPGGPFYGYFGPFFSSQMKSEYDKSLESLKRVVESEKPAS